MSISRKSVFYLLVLVAAFAAGAFAQSVQPYPLNTPVYRLPHPNSYGDSTAECIPYFQLPMAIKSDDGTVTVFYNDGKRSGVPPGCNSKISGFVPGHYCID